MRHFTYFSVRGACRAEHSRQSATNSRRHATWLKLGVFALAAALCASQSLAAPAAGDTFVYRVVNGYNKETVGHLRHELTPATTSSGQIALVTPNVPALGLQRTEIQTAQGQWLRHPLDNHGMAVDHEFSPALPAMPAPHAPGQSWSVRVNAKVPGISANRSVRVDGEVLGNELIRVPAGEFDTVKIRRVIYPGDAVYFKTETRIHETDWYSPSLGRSVRTETRSNWREPCRRGYCDFRGDWHIVELIETQALTR